MKRFHLVGLVSLLILGLMSFNSQGRVAKSHAPAIAQTGCVPAPSGLVSWWPGDGNADDIVGGNNGTLRNGATFATGQVQQAFSFDGVDDYVNAGRHPSLDITGDITLEAWIKPDTIGSYARVIYKGSGDRSAADMAYVLGVNGNSVYFGLAKGGGQTWIESGGGLIPGTWHYIVGVLNGTSMKTYVNGIEKGSASFTGPIDIEPRDLLIGGDDTSGRDFDGLVDEVEIFNRALSQAEIQAIYNAGSAGKCKNNPPEARCQDVTVSAGPSCTANASINNGSFDPDSDPITLSQSPPGPYSLGTTTVMLTVTDDESASSQCTAMVTVVDNTPPALTCPAALTVGTNNCCLYIGSIGNATATDNCDGSVSVSNTAPTAFPLGSTGVTWKATDDAGNMNTCAQSVTVKDMTAPPVSGSVIQSSLWPSNHDLVNVGLLVTASDQCDAGVTINVMVFGDEDDEEPTGDGTHSPDAKDIAPGTLRLRSERKGDADGRVYLIVVKATDDAGNTGVSCSTVVVPKSQSQVDVNAVNAQAASARSFCLTNNGAPPSGYVVIGNGPVIGSKQ
jgi:hypothetical protein